MKINSICIAGGGTSGWLTAGYLLKNLETPVPITLIESKKIGPIGVGEGTQPYTSTFLRKCGLEPKDWMKSADATFKLGVEFVNWQDINFFVDNDSIKSHQINTNNLVHNFWVGKEPKEYFDWLPAYNLAKNNVSPKLSEDLDFVVGSDNTPAEAVHFNAVKIGETLASHFKHKLNYIEGEIDNIEVSEDGIKSIKLTSGDVVTADLYIDCTGFNSLLIEKSLRVEHISITATLPCDKAVAIPTAYTDPRKECFPYTQATTMSAGWRWKIPTFGRVGNGYVYSSKFITKGEAEAELRKELNEYTAPALHLDMRCGYKDNIAVKNVVAVGLSAGFVEPLEATGITFTTKTVEVLCDYLNSFENQFNSTVKASINSYFFDMVMEIVAFIFLHYKTSSRRDTDFWKSFDQDYLPSCVRIAANYFVPEPPNTLRQQRVFDMFHSGQWFQVFNSCGQYKNIENRLDPEEQLYHKIYLEMLKTRTDMQVSQYPNHYDFLKSWYSKLD